MLVELLFAIILTPDFCLLTPVSLNFYPQNFADDEHSYDLHKKRGGD